MYSVIICIAALIAGYFIYGKYLERLIIPRLDVKTPAYQKTDNVDYLPMPTWKVFMIQFLNIAGTGPIFGAILGAKFGPACYLWIVLGSIFAGAFHDYLSGVMSIRGGGASLPHLIYYFLGKPIARIMLVVTILLLLLVGGVFVYSPALVINESIAGTDTTILLLIVAIFAYYIIATLLPIDKIIGKIYPVFAFSLIFMALGLLVCLFVKWPDLPEIWEGLQNRQADLGGTVQPMFPCLFITVACGAISGFHATQSPMMARCIKSEKYARPVFYGAMITEGIIAVIWAAIGSYFFFDGGAQELGLPNSAGAPVIVTKVAKSWLGVIGGTLAILGVVAAPITTGDTALRSARLIIAGFFKVDQKPLKNRLFVSLPIFICCGLLVWYNVKDPNGFNNIWQYFGFVNQAFAVFTLWAIAVYLSYKHKAAVYLLSSIPAMFMTVVAVTFICSNKIGFNLPLDISISIAFVVALTCNGVFHSKSRKRLLATEPIPPEK